MKQFGKQIRRFLDGLYLVGGLIGAGFLLLILLIIVAQVIARWTGHVLPGSTAYAGYCMAAASFFSLAYALNHGAHIRVSQDATPLWIPQIAMGLGTTLLFIAFIDNFYRVLFFGEHGIEAEKLKSLEAE
jgi:TRAP-type C4-dicarboxylate transport system permease small subunit